MHQHNNKSINKPEDIPEILTYIQNKYSFVPYDETYVNNAIYDIKSSIGYIVRDAIEVHDDYIIIKPSMTEHHLYAMSLLPYIFEEEIVLNHKYIMCNYAGRVLCNIEFTIYDIMARNTIGFLANVTHAIFSNDDEFISMITSEAEPSKIQLIVNTEDEINE